MANKAKNLGRQLEHRIAERAREKGLESERHWGSGTVPGLRGDGHIADALYEAKVRTATMNARGEKQLTIPLEDFYKVQRQAAEAGYKLGVMVANMKGGRAPVVILGLDDFLVLLAQAKGLTNEPGLSTIVE